MVAVSTLLCFGFTVAGSVCGCGFVFVCGFDCDFGCWLRFWVLARVSGSAGFNVELWITETWVLTLPVGLV